MPDSKPAERTCANDHRHLIGPLVPDGVPIEISEAQKRLRPCVEYLVRQAQAAVKDLHGKTSGREMKRVKVTIESSSEHPYVGRDVKEQPLSEVMNQVATAERVLDVLAWAATHADFKNYLVRQCHPTTSSFKDDDETASSDHDLVLCDGDGELCAFFEVSDVASEKDGNQKELHDLISLGALTDGDGEDRYPDPKPTTPPRRFMVVAPEFAVRLDRGKCAWRIDEWIKYSRTPVAGDTVVFEVSIGCETADARARCRNRRARQNRQT